MLEYLKYTAYIVLGFVLICLLFLGVRSVDVLFLNIFDIAVCDVVRTDYIAGFNGYRDYVTVLTGLLTLIIGATGIGAFLSFKKFRAEEQKVLDALEVEKDKIVDRRNQLDMFLKIEEARNNLEYEWGFLSAIQLYDKAEAKCDSHYLLYALRGNAYYFAAKRSIGLSEGRETLYLEKARCDFESAVEKNKNSMLAVYGLGQVLFQQALMFREKKEIFGIDWGKLPPVGKKDLDAGGINKLKQLRLKQDGDYLGAEVDLASKSILHTQDAMYKGYDEVVGDYALATMYEAVDDVERAYEYYKKAYEKGHLPSGYQYCYLWLRKNDINECEQCIDKIVEILKRVSIDGDGFTNAAYALLLFIYINKEDKQENAIDVYRHLDKFTIENLFEMVKA